MASSRNRPRKPEPADVPLQAGLRRLLAGTATGPVVVAFSGGPDSTALLDLCLRLRDERTPGFKDLRAVHVHHGLQDAADHWVAHCEQFCAQRKVPLTVRHVAVARSRGVEDGARRARYEALQQAAGRPRAAPRRRGDERGRA